MQRLALLLTLATAATLATFEVGCASAAPEDEESKGGDEVVQAKSIAADDAIVAVTSPNKPSWICSGSVIAPRVVLTAAHCVEGGNSDKTGWSFSVYFGVNRNKKRSTDATIKVKEFHFPKMYREVVLDGVADQTADDLDGDIAVLILEKATKVKPLAWNKEALTESLVGKNVRFVGYGLDGPKGDPGSKNGVRKMATLPVEALSEGAVAIPGAKVNPCHGDSGGPLLLEEDGVSTILGVGHMMNGESCREGANYERTDKYADFIAEMIAANP